MVGENADGHNYHRPLLPQTTQMQSFTFAPPTLAPRENQRNYVFVDEHNRHKRLKVMRACEGCRRRKIKCDAATTNSWPCAACVRLKLTCVPPTMSYDQDMSSSSEPSFSVDQNQAYMNAAPAPSPNEAFQAQHAVPQQSAAQLAPGFAPSMPHSTQGGYTEDLRLYQQAPYMQMPPGQDALQYNTSTATSMPPPEQKYQPPPQFSGPGTSPVSATRSDGVYRSESSGDSLADVLGELKIDHVSVASYITSQKKSLAETPAVEDYEVSLPKDTSPDLTVRVPPAMMPPDQQAMQYFDYYFANIHPYIPVLSRSQFYQQWHTRRESISPLIIESIFACTLLMLGDAEQGNKWLAVASRHEESFKDVPRLSTIQATVLLLKARESAPKRGYFYRSWMMIVNAVAMAKDLELDQHHELHRSGKSCGSSAFDCVAKTRVWQALFMLELMIGGPQGRTDFGVDTDTVDFSVPQTNPGLDDAEMQTSRQFAYQLHLLKNIRISNGLYAKLRKKSANWAFDPEFVQHNQDFITWTRSLPQDLQIIYPNDGSAPWIPSHYLANVHCHHYLAVVMQHRPQVHFSSDSGNSPWKHHMLVCLSSAQNMCRLQEAILQTYGLPGLLCMQRGISFTIYAVLTCVMLHLVAITSPDPDINTDARDYFTRHMRILEQCAPVWPMPEMQAQISALREAFSADTNKPFELKPTFPFGSPVAGSNISPISGDGQYHPRRPTQDPSMEHSGQVHYNVHPITPPTSTTGSEPKADSPVGQSMVMMAAGQRQPAPPTSAGVQSQEHVQWNPTKIFDQWNVAFGTPPQPTSSSQTSPPLRPPAAGNYELRTPQEPQAPGYSHQASVSPHGNQLSPHSGQLPAIQTNVPQAANYISSASPATNYVSPGMWQEAVQSSFGGGLKRQWDYGNQGMMNHAQLAKRRA